MKHTLEQICKAKQFPLGNWYSNDWNEWVAEHFETIIASLTLAEQVAKGEVVLEQPWQPIETAPKDGHAISVFIKSPKTGDTWHDVVCYNDIENQFMHGLVYVGHDFITHWKPLTYPTQEASDEQD